MRRWIYLDLPLGVFVGLMLSAAAITSHGTWAFYSLILPPALALAATIVLTAGIPAMELAAVLDRKGRWRHILVMLGLLSLEAFAQYLQAQTTFKTLITERFPNPAGIDLATFAAEPRGRWLPIAFLAALSIFVVATGYAASARIRDLRAQAANMSMEANELAILKDTIAERDTTIAQRDATIREREAMISDLHTQLSEQDGSAQATIYDLKVEIGNLHEQLALASAPVTAQVPQFALVLRYMSEQIALHKSVAVIAAATGFSESTLRGWLPRVRADHNGHVEEVV